MITCLNNAFKSLLRFLKENGFPYKCRLYVKFAIRNELLYSGFVLPNVQIYFVQKISFATFGVSIDDFLRYAGLGYSLCWPIVNFSVLPLAALTQF